MIGSFKEGKTGQAFCGRNDYESNCFMFHVSCFLKERKNCFIGALKENSGYGGLSTSLAIRGSFLPLLGEVSYLFRGESELGEISYLFRGGLELGD